MFEISKKCIENHKMFMILKGVHVLKKGHELEKNHELKNCS